MTKQFCKMDSAVEQWSARQSHTLEVASSNLARATTANSGDGKTGAYNYARWARRPSTDYRDAQVSQGFFTFSLPDLQLIGGIN